MTQPPEPNERIIEAEVVSAHSQAGQPVKVERVNEAGLSQPRLVSRGVFTYDTAKLTPDAIRRVRARLGLLALSALAGAGLVGWFAATTSHVLVAAVMLLVCAALVVLALLLGAAWRLMGRLPR